MQAPDQDSETLEFSAVDILPSAISEDLDGEFFGPLIKPVISALQVSVK